MCLKSTGTNLQGSPLEEHGGLGYARLSAILFSPIQAFQISGVDE